MKRRRRSDDDELEGRKLQAGISGLGLPVMEEVAVKVHSEFPALWVTSIVACREVQDDQLGRRDLPILVQRHPVHYLIANGSRIISHPPT